MKILHRAPYRCRNCKNRFYVYIAPERDAVEETAEQEQGEPEQAEEGETKAEATHNPDSR
jgi:hypothetical protein